MKPKKITPAQWRALRALYRCGHGASLRVRQPAWVRPPRDSFGDEDLVVRQVTLDALQTAGVVSARGMLTLPRVRRTRQQYGDDLARARSKVRRVFYTDLGGSWTVADAREKIHQALDGLDEVERLEAEDADALPDDDLDADWCAFCAAQGVDP